MRDIIFTTILISITLLGCGKQNVRNDSVEPAWVLGDSKEFPRRQYLLGVGESDTMAGAKSRARAEIARIFSVDIRTQFSDSSSVETQQTGQHSLSSESMVVAQEIESQTNQLLRGVEVPKVWKSNTNQRYYALAVLPRLKSSASLRKEINALDEATRTIIASANTSPSLFRKIRLSNEAVKLQFKRHILAQQLSVVALTDAAANSQWPVEKLVAHRNDLISRVTVKVRVDGSEKKTLKTVLANSLANHGFTVTDEGEYLINASLNASTLEPRQGWFYNKGTLVLSILGEGGKTLGGHNWNFKVSATQAELSRIRVIEKAQSIFDSELKDHIFKIMEANQL